VISFQRPASMSESEMRAWIAERARAHQPRLALGAQHGSDNEHRLLRVKVPAHGDGAADEQLAELMMDMRLLGLRPMVLPAAG
jgi:hypothetical protein